LLENPTRIGLLSFAHGHAHSYTESLRRRRDVEVVGVYDTDVARGRLAATRHELPFYATVDALLAQELDGVIICAENANHWPLAQRAAGRVRGILCEKPITTTLADAQAMIDRCAETSTKLQIAFPVRYAPAVRWLKTQLDADAFGQVYAVQTTNHGSMPGGWFADPVLAGGGAVIDHTVHVIDLLRWLWQTEVTEVYAEVGHGLLHRGLAIDDVGLLSFRLANGIYGTLDTSWSRSRNYLTWGDVKIDLVAEKGVVYVDAFRQHITVSSHGAGKTRWEPWGSDMDQGLVNDFILMLRADHAPTITGEDGLRALEVALAAYQSAQSGQPVTLPLSS